MEGRLWWRADLVEDGLGALTTGQLIKGGRSLVLIKIQIRRAPG